MLDPLDSDEAARIIAVLFVAGGMLVVAIGMALRGG